MLRSRCAFIDAGGLVNVTKGRQLMDSNSGGGSLVKLNDCRRSEQVDRTLVTDIDKIVGIKKHNFFIYVI